MVHIPASRDQFYKTKMCPHYQTGECRKGDECYFAHSKDELRILPNLRKTKLCEEWQRTGCCFRGESCSYAHGEKELRFTDGYFKTDLCKYWKSGVCHAGYECRHAHGSNELRPRKFQEEEIQRMCNEDVGLAKVITDRQSNLGGCRNAQPFSSGYITPIAGVDGGRTSICSSFNRCRTSGNLTMRHVALSHGSLAREKVGGYFTPQARPSWTGLKFPVIPDTSPVSRTPMNHCPTNFCDMFGVQVMDPHVSSMDQASLSAALRRSSGVESFPAHLCCPPTIGVIPSNAGTVPVYPVNLPVDTRRVPVLPNLSGNVAPPCKFVAASKEHAGMMSMGVYRSMLSTTSLSRTSTTCSGSVAQDRSSELVAIQELQTTSSQGEGDEHASMSTPSLVMGEISPPENPEVECLGRRGNDKRDITAVPMTWSGSSEDALEVDEGDSLFCETSYSTLAQGAGMYSGSSVSVYQNVAHDGEIMSAVVSCVSVEEYENPSTDVSNDSGAEVNVEQEHEDESEDASLEEEYHQVLAATDVWENDCADMSSDSLCVHSIDSYSSKNDTTLSETGSIQVAKRVNGSNKPRRGSQKTSKKETTIDGNRTGVRKSNFMVRIPSPPPIPPPPKDLPPPPSFPPPPPPPPPEKSSKRHTTLVEKVTDFNAQFPVRFVGKNVRDKFKRKSTSGGIVNIAGKPLPPVPSIIVSGTESKQSDKSILSRRSASLAVNIPPPPPPLSYACGIRKNSSSCLIPPPPPDTTSTCAPSTAGSGTTTPLPLSPKGPCPPLATHPHCAAPWAGEMVLESSKDIARFNTIPSIIPEGDYCTVMQSQAMQQFNSTVNIYSHPFQIAPSNGQCSQFTSFAPSVHIPSVNKDGFEFAPCSIGPMCPISNSVPISIQSMLAGVTLEQLQSAQLLPECYED